MPANTHTPEQASASNSSLMRYADALTAAMDHLGQDPRVVFLGQAVAVPGTAMFGTLKNIPLNRRIELPVEEDMQMGMSIGLALKGAIPVSIFPRWNFLLLAANQLVNHLDKMSELCPGTLPPKVIIRTSIGSERPLHPGPQHVGDHTEAFRAMCPRMEIVRLEEAADIVPAYAHALARPDGKSTLLVEYGDYYNEK